MKENRCDLVRYKKLRNSTCEWCQAYNGPCHDFNDNCSYTLLQKALEQNLLKIDDNIVINIPLKEYLLMKEEKNLYVDTLNKLECLGIELRNMMRGAGGQSMTIMDKHYGMSEAGKRIMDILKKVDFPRKEQF